MYSKFKQVYLCYCLYIYEYKCMYLKCVCTPFLKRLVSRYIVGTWEMLAERTCVGSADGRRVTVRSSWPRL